MHGTTKKDKYERIKEKKIATSAQTLCEGLPKTILQYFNYVRDLKFEDKPDYNYMKKLFKDHLILRGCETDIYFDWLLKKMGRPIASEEYADHEESSAVKKTKSIRQKQSNNRLGDAFKDLAAEN